MTKKQILKPVFMIALLIGFAVALPKPASAIKYMSLKEAIKYFMPPGTKPSKVVKSIPAGKLEAIKKRFGLRATPDYKETIKTGPYTFYVARDSAGTAKAYIVILEQYWKTCYHKFAVGINADGSIKELIVTELNCHYAYPINKKSFLKQFNGKKVAPGKPVEIKLGHDIDGISGATFSSDIAAIVTRRALALHELFFASK